MRICLSPQGRRFRSIRPPAFLRSQRKNGASLVILNREPTDLDSLADLVLNMEIGPTLGGVVGVN